MARIEIDPNYTTPTFSRATAGTDPFKMGDVQTVAAALSTHDHTSGKGMPLHSSAFVGSLDIVDWYRSTGHTSAFATTAAGAEFYYDGTNAIFQGYDRSGSGAQRPVRLQGLTVTLVAGGSSFVFDASGNVTVPANVTAGGQLTATNGNLYLGSSHFYASGAADLQTGANLVVNGTAQVTANVVASGNVQANGTIIVGSSTNLHLDNSGDTLYIHATGVYLMGAGASSTPVQLTMGALTCTTIQTNGNVITSGAINASGTITAPTVNSSGNHSVQNNVNNVVPYTLGGTAEHIEHGHTNVNGVNNNSGQSLGQTFTRPFVSTPIVLCTIDTPSSGDIENWEVAAQSVNTTGFNLRCYNSSGSTGNCTVWWFAMGT